MYVRKLLIALLILLLMCNIVYAGNDTADYSNIVNETVKNVGTNKVIALENGHFNTSFSDGSNGYCLEYGEQEASVNDTFYKVDTSYAKNNLDNQKVGNYIKLFFVEYTDYALSDSVRTQHYIWHFTDNFNGWRLNYTIIDAIKNSNRIIPDYYEENLGNGTVRCFEFNVLLALYEHHQNYFTYKIFYMNKTNDNATNNSNSFYNNTILQWKKNHTIDKNINFRKDNIQDDKNVIPYSLSRVTGFSVLIPLFIMVLIGLITYKNIRKR